MSPAWSRRRLLTAVGTGWCAAVAGCVSGSESPKNGTDWPTVGQDGGNTRYAETGAVTRSPTTKWEQGIEIPFGQPTVADGTVYIPDQRGLRAYNAETGAKLWAETTDNRTQSGLFTPPTVRDGVVYTGIDNGHHSVMALNADTGKRLWTFGGKDVGAVTVAPTLNENGDSLYIGTASSQLHALDSETGERRWSKKLFGPVDHTLAVRTPLVVGATRAGEVYAYDESGKELWRKRLPSGTVTPPILSGRWLFIGSKAETVYAMDPTNGEAGWDIEIGQLSKGGLAVSPNALFAVSGRAIVTVGRKEGEMRRSIGVDSEITSRPMILDETIYLGGERLTAINASGGISVLGLEFDTKRWTMDIDGRVGPGMAAGDGRLYVPIRSSEGATLKALA